MAQVRDYRTYRQIADDPRCREILGWAASDASTSMSGEQFLDMFGKVAAVPLPLGAVGRELGRAYAAMGMSTGKTQSRTLDQPFGYALLGALCFLASKAMPIADVADGEGHCLVQAVIPSNMLSWKGRLMIGIQASDRGVLAEASTKIPGQMMDWGRSTRLLRELFEDIDARSVSFASKGL